MGQAYYAVSLDAGEYMRPHAFSHGYKLSEIAQAQGGLMQALAILLADGNGRGGGDFDAPDPDPENVAGRWAGHRVIMTGDYADSGKFVPEGYESNLYQYARENFTDISEQVISRIKAANEKAEKA